MPEAATESLRQKILDALDVDVPRPRLSLPYRTGLLLVATVMVILPLIYLAIVAGAAYGVYWHATENLSMFEGSGSSRGKLIGYVTPLVIGAVLVFFMLKPLLAPRGKAPERFVADPQQHPFLYDFVHELCAAVGAPKPRRILLDCEANASAGFHQGGMGIASSGRELTIGLPLVAGLQIRELAGILAHEFGHFSQGAAMRLSFLVNGVNRWFARVAYQRDSWDEALKSWAGAGIGYISVPAIAAQGCVWLTRRLLVGLMYLGHAVSSNMSRQMEYDADSFKIQLAGSQAFKKAMLGVVEISVAHDHSGHSLSESWAAHQLPDDLPGFVAAEHGNLRPEQVAQIHASLAGEDRSVFASHPRMVDRIAVAEKAGAEGIFAIDAPASILFDDFAAVCREVSRAHYQEVLGREFKQARLIHLDAYLGERRRSGDEAEAALRVFQGTDNRMRSLPWPVEPGGESLEALRQDLVQRRPQTERCITDLVQVHDALANIALAQFYLRLDVRIDAPQFGLEKGDLGEARQRSEQLAAQRLDAEQAADAHQALASQRLATLLARAPEGAERTELERLVAALPDLAAIVDSLVLVRGQLSVLSPIFELQPDEKHAEQCGRMVEGLLQKLHGSLQDLRGRLEGRPDPLDEGGRSLAEAVLPSLPGPKRPEKLWDAAVRADQLGGQVQARLAGRIATQVEALEAALGLEALPLPRRDQAPAQDAG